MSKMRTFFLGSAATALTLGFASQAALAVDTRDHTAPALSWAGFYGGLSHSRVSGHGLNSRMLFDFTTTDGLGGFVGYNWQRGGFVFGGELSYIDFDTSYWMPYVHQSNTLELRARGGYAAGNVMVYGFVGGARSALTTAWGMGGTPENQDGYVYGFGLEAMVASNVSVGIELARRRLELSGRSTDGVFIETVSVRVGYHF